MTRDIGRIDVLSGDKHFDFKIAASTISTHYDPKPIPLRQFDWSAVRGDFDLGSLIGHGSTELEAIEELLDLEGWCHDER